MSMCALWEFDCFLTFLVPNIPNFLLELCQILSESIAIETMYTCLFYVSTVPKLSQYFPR